MSFVDTLKREKLEIAIEVDEYIKSRYQKRLVS
jgi:hypothetical protein